MNTQEKARRYDEALRKVKDMLSYKEVRREDMEYIFPELKESGDEKIRKELISFVRGMLACHDKPNAERDEKYESWIAWLEKQDEQILANSAKTCKDEQKPVIDIGIPFGAKDSELQEVSYHIPEGFHAEIEGNKVIIKKGEQTPAGKVEPKFKIGDWLVENEPNNYARFVQILEVINVQGKDKYRISRDLHNDEDIVAFGFIEYNYHSFNIKDAEDGDVLADDKGSIFIFRGIGNQEWNDVVDFYVALGSLEREITIQYDNNFWGTVETAFVPATKEQRNLLFQKMKEEGYEWDAEKKDLKKTEQPPAWSEEDDNCLSTIIAEFSKCSGKSVSKDEWMRCNDFLNSLKDRIQPQSKQEWSDKDKTMAFTLMRDVEQMSYISIEGKNERIGWLNKLPDNISPQNRWKPSDEQMKALGIAIQSGILLGTWEEDALKSLKEQLKKI